MKTVLLATFLFVCLSSYSQTSPKSIEGYLFSTNSDVISHANISLLHSKDSTFVAGTVSNDSGYFQFFNVDPGNYVLRIQHVSFQKKSLNIAINEEREPVILKKIEIEPEEVLLNELSIQSAKPLFIKKNDRLVFQVEGSVINSLKTTLIELIRNLPGIWIDQNNNILLNGQENVQVTIDNKSTYLTRGDLLRILNSVPVNNVEEVEIIFNPSAKNDAEGSAIINIKTKNKIDTGFNGSVVTTVGKSLGYNEFYPRFNSGINLSLGTRIFSVFANYNYSYQESLRNITEKLTFESSTLNQSIQIENVPDQTHNFQTGIDYTLAKNQSAKLLYTKNYTSSNVDQTNSIIVSNDVGFHSNVLSTANETLNSNQDAINLEYINSIDSSNTLIVSSDFIYLNKDHLANYDNSFVEEDDSARDETLTNNSKTNIGVWASRIDYSYKFSAKSSLEVGLKYSYIKTENEVEFGEVINSQYFKDTALSNSFSYEEKMVGSYVSYTTKFNKFELISGVRYENSGISGRSLDEKFKRNISGFFPNVSLNYSANENLEWGIYYSRRIKRPGYVDINPFVYYVNPYTRLEGNPNLIPSITNKFQYTLLLQKMYSATISYYHTNDIFITAQFQDVQSKEQRLIPTNIGDLSNIELSLGAPVNIIPWWEGYFNISLYHQKYTENPNAGLGFLTNSKTTFQLFSQHIFTIPGGISLEISNTIVTPSVQGQFGFSTIHFYSLGAKKSLFNNKLDLKIGFNDFLKTLKYDGTLGGIGWNSRYQDQGDSRQLNISLNYNFYTKGKVNIQKPKGISKDEIDRMN